MSTSRDTLAAGAPSADGAFYRAGISSWRFGAGLKRDVKAQTSGDLKRNFYGVFEGAGEEAARAMANALVCSVVCHRPRAPVSFEYWPISEYCSTSLECAHACLPNKRSSE